MAMYICLECGRTFDRPRETREIHRELAERPAEIWRECPFCANGGFEEAERCELCGTYISKSQARFRLCPACEVAAEVRLKQILSERFTKNELEYLNNQYDGEYFGL